MTLTVSLKLALKGWYISLPILLVVILKPYIASKAIIIHCGDKKKCKIEISFYTEILKFRFL